MKLIYLKPELQALSVEYDVIRTSLNPGDMDWITKDDLDKIGNN